MSETDFDHSLITAAFRLAAESGWSRVTVAAAARDAGLSLAEARDRFPGRTAILLRFGRIADQAALQDTPATGPVRDRLFDLLMRRYDALQPHRDGIKALLRALPFDPPLALLLHSATHRSMRWMLQACGVPASGPRGELEMRGLTAIWYWTLRTWEKDDTEDLSATMATLDTALQRADRMATWMHRSEEPDALPPPSAEPGAGELDPADPIIESAASEGVLPLDEADPLPGETDPPPIDTGLPGGKKD